MCSQKSVYTGNFIVDIIILNGSNTSTEAWQGSEGFNMGHNAVIGLIICHYLLKDKYLLNEKVSSWKS